MTTLTWLHLSDLHFRTSGGRSWDRDIVLSSLRKDIEERMAQDGLRPDLILFTGDVAFSGQAEEYALASAFFDDLLRLTGLPKSRFFAIPGNHDVDRRAISRSANVVASSLTDRSAVNDLLTHGDDRRLILRRLDGYARFVNEYFASLLPFDDERFFYAQHLTGLSPGGRRIAVLGLNSAWLCAGDEDLGRLVIGERQVRRALEASSDADLRIALVHHPFNWLQEFDQDDSEALLMQGCAFILHGHLHRAGVRSLKTPDAGAMILAAGASYESRQYQNGYNWVRLDLESGQGVTYLRAYSDRGGGFWTKDVATYKNAPDGEFRFALPEAPKPSARSRTAAPALTPAATAVLEATYLRRVQQDANVLPLWAIDPRGVERTLQKTMDLLPIYVALNTTASERVEPEGGGRKRKGTAQEAMPGEEREIKPISVLEAAGRERWMVLLGDPGSGKSTFVNYLALCLAGARLEGMGESLAEPGADWLAQLAPPWPHGALLPLQVTLRQFARSECCTGTANGLWSFIAATLAERGLADFAPVLRQRLMEGGVFVLLDGLDEVADDAQRRLVRDAVSQFVATFSHSGNRILVTCRSYAYQDSQYQLDRFAEYTAAPFNLDQSDTFVDCWYHEVCRLRWKEDAEARVLAERLKEACRRPDLTPLAANPLQLVMMASLQFSWGRLPDDRVELYAEMARLLLVRWQEARLGSESGVTQTISIGNLESALERVAFVAHRQQSLPEGAADISEALLLSVFKDYFDGSWDRAKELVHYIRNRAGLLLDRGAGAFAFPHRSYQEYLAGSYLAVQPEFPDETAALVRDNYPQWREVALWATGAMTRQKKMPHIAVDLAAALCSREDPPAQVAPSEWRMAYLAGDVLREIGLPNVLARERHQPVAARVQRWLLALVQRGALAPGERAGAGVTLGFLGDPRFAGLYGLPDFVLIDGGTFWMGSEQAEVDQLVKEIGENWYKRELPRHQVELSPFAIARFPTTVAMFQCFIDAGGYRDERWWAEAIAADLWTDGQFRDYWRERNQPEFWNDTRLNGPSQPVVGVTWYEAVAYCRWLTAALDDGHVYRLPTEAQWERAARGPHGWRYPWGDDWIEGRANSNELGLERTTPVGIFPDGASAEGVLDLSGNVWEWCSDWYGEKTYGERAKRVERDPQGPLQGDFKILRGASWNDNRTNVRCACRDRIAPDGRVDLLGFRVARGPLK